MTEILNITGFKRIWEYERDHQKITISWNGANFGHLIIKSIIDPKCSRHTAVIENWRVLLTFRNGPDKPSVRIIPRCKNYEVAGKKATTYTNRIWIGHADLKSVSEVDQKDQDANLRQLIGVLHPEGSVEDIYKAEANLAT
ncbi:unnamed protein product [Dovyalis caffra]|uniref:Uncharacterized protein n=1 Tax=Dovyalis caffra TaxID=77055 RepID=A0AAV1RYK7_9ROSI|nr:unnamed protein product [Dovyalis caffra]